MTMDEKYDCLECDRIHDHEAFKGFYSAKMGFWEVLRQIPSHSKRGEIYDKKDPDRHEL